MQVQSIQNTIHIKQKATPNKTEASPKILPQQNYLSNVFYQPVSFGKLGAYLTSQSDELIETTKKLFPKLNGIYGKDGKTIDLAKLTYENFTSGKFDIAKATDDEINAYRGVLALMEAYHKNPNDTADIATEWLQRFSPDQVSTPLAVSHFLSALKVQEDIFAVNREMLKNPAKCKSLDVAVFDKKGNFNIDAVVFDTETTGVKVEKDRIVQIGASLLKKGRIAKTYDQLINPEMHIPEGATDKNGITDDMVKDAPKIEEVMKDFLNNFMKKENGIIVTWNGIRFDMPLLNRTIREIRSANDIKAGNDLDKIVMEKQLYKVIDAQILHLRIHPYVGASKKLGQQYQQIFLQEMKDAHNALADVKGTAALFKYDLYWLNGHRIDKSKPLTLRQVLLFQNGEPEVPNISVKLDEVMGINTSVNMKDSYVRPRLRMENYFDSYDLKIIETMADEIGPENMEKAIKSGIINEKIEDKANGLPLHGKETKKRPKSDKKQSLTYLMRESLERMFNIADIQGYNGKSKEEIRELIAQKSMTYTDTVKDVKLRSGIWQKNINSKDKGNDLPDNNIARRVMSEVND